MERLGTDVMAVAMILGGGAIAAGATVLLAEAGDDAHLSYNECSGDVEGQRIRVTVGHGDDAVIVAPDVQVRASGDCVEAVRVVDVSVEKVDRRVAQARTRAEQARERAVRAQERELRGQERDVRAQERDVRAQERSERVERVRVRSEDFDFEHDFDFEFDFDHDFDFDFDFDDLEFDFQGNGFQINLEGLEQLGVQLEGLEVEGMDEELRVEIEVRLADEMKRLEERLSRMNRGSGR